MYIVMSTSCTERPSLWCRCRSPGTPSSALAPTIASPSTTPFEGFRNLRLIFLDFSFLQVVHKQPARKLHRLRQRDNLLKRQPGKRKWTGGQNDVIILLWYSSTHKILLLKNFRHVPTKTSLNWTKNQSRGNFMAFCGSLTASSSRTVWTWTQRGWSVWQRTGRRSSTGERSKCSTFISAIAIVLLLNIIIIESILDNHNSKAEYFPCSRMKKIADGLIHYRRSSESSSITSSSAGSVGLFTPIKYFLDDARNP